MSAIANEQTLRQALPTMIHPRFSLSALLLIAVSMLAGACSPVGMAIGAGATAGIAASEERGIEGTARDAAIRVEISELWLDEGFDFYHALELQIYEGRVLLTGRVPSQEIADTAVRHAWQPDDVTEVINEIEILEGDLAELATDSLTAAKLRAELTFTRDVRAINYSIRVIEGVVYLLGVAQDEAEIGRVVRTLRATSGVRGIVNHVITRDDPRRADRDDNS